MTVPHFDVAVIGAGPAGSAAARLLSSWSHSVLLIDRPGGQSRTLAESIPPSAQKLLARLGLLTALEDARFPLWRGNTVTWGTASRVEPFVPGAAGYLVQRLAFDRLLLDLAVGSGATCWTGSVRSTEGIDGDGDISLVVDPEPGAAAARQASATFVIDASGRAGLLARSRVRRRTDAPHTIALAGRWRTTAEHAFGHADPGHTVVASYRDGWAWSVPTAGDERQITVMVDPERTSLEGDGAPEIYRRELSKVTAFGPLLEHARLEDGPWGADASAYTADHYAERRFLLVGDAGSFIDPLSSFGVKKALASAWLGAIATHTLLEHQAMRTHALEFFDTRERRMAAALGAQAAQFAADAAGGGSDPDLPAFWSARTLGAADAAGEDPEDAGPLARDPQVLAAFDALRTRPSATMSISADVRLVARPAVRGNQIVLDDHLVLPEWPEGIRYLRHVDLLALTRLAPREVDVGRLYEVFVREQSAVPLPDFLGALSVLIARGALRLEP